MPVSIVLGFGIFGRWDVGNQGDLCGGLQRFLRDNSSGGFTVDGLQGVDIETAPIHFCF